MAFRAASLIIYPSVNVYSHSSQESRDNTTWLYQNSKHCTHLWHSMRGTLYACKEHFAPVQTNICSYSRRTH